MKEFIEKLIGRLEEKVHLYYKQYMDDIIGYSTYNRYKREVASIISIVNQLAEEYNPKTNADRIRSMSDEELANTLVQDVPCKICEYWSEEISSCNAPFSFVCTKGYAEALYLKWLQSEAK